MIRLLLSSLTHYRAINVAVVLGVAVAVAVLAGALLVGASVRESLRAIAVGRLGATDLVLSSSSFLRSALADELAADSSVSDAFRSIVPIIALDATVVHEDSRRIAARVQVYGIDQRFGAFHGADGFDLSGREAVLSPALASELGAAINDNLILRVAKPTDIPLGMLQGRRDEAGERIRLVTTAVLATGSLAEFSLTSAQGPALALFVPLERLQRDLDLGPRVNTLLFAQRALGSNVETTLAHGRTAITSHLRLDDLGLSALASPDQKTLIIEGRGGVVAPTVAEGAIQVARALGTVAQPALAYLANTIRVGARSIPYSLVTAIDAVAPAATDHVAEPIWLNEWAVTELQPQIGEAITLDYFLWSDEAGLTTRTAAFQFAGVLPMQGLGGDRTLVPDYPGITDARDVTAWDPPFPVDLSRVQPRDEQYWDTWRTAPKAIVPLARGQALWPSAFGSVSSLRLAVPDGMAAADFATRVSADLLATLDPFAAGLTLRHARAEAVQAAAGTTDFGEYFVYFSFFLLMAGLLLAGMFFAMGAEQRAREIGLLSALGFDARAVQRLLTREAVLLTALGSVLGAIAAIAYAGLIMYGLSTWWVGAVGTTALQLHVSPLSLLAGTAGAFVAALAALRLTVRRLLRRTPRDLLSGDATSPMARPSPARARRRTSAAVAFALLAIALASAAGAGLIGQVAGFFACGGSLLVAGLLAYSAWLWRPASGAPATSVARLGMRYSRWRPGRSVVSAALIAFACFVLVAVSAFRRDQVGTSLARESGTGGFSLMAESVAPLMHDPNTSAGRSDLGWPAADAIFADTHIARFRLRPGDEASCLNLYRPANPRIIAPEARFIDERRFSFASTLAATPEEHANPWLLLNRHFEDGAVATIVDQTSLLYVFHLALGDDFVLPASGEHPRVHLRIVAALADSMLQSELVIGEDAFVGLFPRNEGYRVWLIDTPAQAAGAFATAVEDQLSDYGVDTIDTRARLAAYHQVENTYLSTFQTLGILGLLIGTLGLSAVLARNVLERRRELGLLRAVGYSAASVRTLIVAESATLIVGGALLGTVAAMVAVGPALLARAQPLPIGSIATLLAAVTITGWVASLGAVRLALAKPVVEAVKAE